MYGRGAAGGGGEGEGDSSVHVLSLGGLNKFIVVRLVSSDLC